METIGIVLTVITSFVVIFVIYLIIRVIALDRNTDKLLKGIPNPISIPDPPLNINGLRNEASISRMLIDRLNEKVWKLENPLKLKVGDLAYPIINDKPDLDKPLLIIDIQYIEGYERQIGFKTYTYIPEHWECSCFDQTKKVTVSYDIHQLGKYQKPDK